MSGIIAFGILLALTFDFLNGMNDAANSIATVVSTRVLTPKLAVAWAAFFNFVGVLGFGVTVANTIGKGIVDPAIVSPQLILCALVGGVVWTHLCTKAGLPISVSHALIGGLVGAGWVKAGTSGLLGLGIAKVAIFIFLAPILGMAISAGLMVVMLHLMGGMNKNSGEALSKKLQLFSAAAFSLSHGVNDAQKTMGIISILLLSGVMTGEQVPHWMYHGAEFYVPNWVVISCYAAISLGTLSGGWGVIRTMGTKITKLRPFSGFAAESGGGLTILVASAFGIPVSTTHTITGSIAGVGMVTNLRAVRWGVASHIIWAWVFTIPVSGMVGALSYYLYLLIWG